MATRSCKGRLGNVLRFASMAEITIRVGVVCGCRVLSCVYIYRKINLKTLMSLELVVLCVVVLSCMCMYRKINFKALMSLSMYVVYIALAYGR